MTFDEFKALPAGSVVRLDSLLFRKEEGNAMWRYLRQDVSGSTLRYYHGNFSSYFGPDGQPDRLVLLSDLETLALVAKATG